MMVGLIRNELHKLFKQKKLYIFMGVVVLNIIFQYISTRYNFSFDKFKYVNGQLFPLKVLNGMYTLVVLFISLILTDMITEEYRNGTFTLILLRPVTRFKFLFSKLAALIVAIMTLQVFTLIMSYIFGLFFFKWGDSLVYSGAKLSITGEWISISNTFSGFPGILFVISAYMLTLLPFMVIGTSMMFISLLFTNMKVTNTISLGLWLVIEPVFQIIKPVRPFLPDSYFYFISAFLKKIDIKEVFVGFAVLLAYEAIFFLSSVVLFKRKDILF